MISLLVRVVTQTASEDSSASRNSWMSLHGFLHPGSGMEHEPCQRASNQEGHQSEDGFPKAWVGGFKQRPGRLTR